MNIPCLNSGTAASNNRSKLIFDQTGAANALLTVPTVAGVAANLAIGNGTSGNSVIVTGNGGPTGTGLVTVYSGSTLGGPGALRVAVMVNGGATLAPGAAGTIGTLATGTASRTTTIHGRLRIKCDGGAADSLAVGGTLTLGTASILDFDTVGAPLTNEAYVIASFTTLNGTFGTVLDLPAGYVLVYDYNDGVSANNLALVKTQTYAEWIAGFYPGVTDPAVIGLDADPDKDGIPNIVENYFGTSPAVPSAGLTHLQWFSPSLLFQYTRADAPLAGFTASFQWSTGLVSWHASDELVGGVRVNLSSSTAVDNPPPADDVMLGIATVTSGSPPILYVRLILTPN